jgi:hypothetical protein
MARHDSVAKRISRDRGVANFFAFIAALPAIAIIGVLAYLAYGVITGPREELASDGGYVLLGISAVFIVLFFIVARWTFDAVRAALTPQRVQAMWLRRFQAESGDTFRTSREIDRLSRHGIAALTLQDRDVQLSFEQRRNRLAPMFWLLFIPLTALLAFALWQGWQGAVEDVANRPQAEGLQEAIGQFFGGFFALLVIGMLLIVGLFFGVLACAAAVMLFAALAGPIGAMFRGKRDDHPRLPGLLKRIGDGKGPRGASIVRISDEHWRDAVTSSLAAVDVAIIDLTNVSEHVAWEIAEAAKACSTSGLVFICRDGAELSDAAKMAVRSALGREHIHVVQYPERRGANGAAFARDLREQIYNAADLRQARQS